MTPRERTVVSPLTGELETREDDGYAASIVISRPDQELSNIIPFHYYAADGKEAVDIGIGILEKIKNDIDVAIEELKEIYK